MSELFNISVGDGKKDHGAIQTKAVSWSALAGALGRCPIGPKAGLFWCPAQFKSATRNLENVDQVNLIVLDCETKKLTPPPLAEVISRCEEKGWRAIGHTTHTHTPESPRFRLVLQPSEPLAPHKLRSWVERVSSELEIYEATDLAASGDAARLFYTPRKSSEDAVFEFMQSEGGAVNVAQCAPDAPESVKKRAAAETDAYFYHVESPQERLEAFLRMNPKAALRFNGSTEGLTDASGSAMDFSMVALLKEGGFGLDEIMDLLATWPHGSADKARHTRRYWQRCFGNTSTEAVQFPELREIKSDLPAVMPFDAEKLLPPVLANYVMDESGRMPCAPDYTAAALLVALGSVLGGRVAIKPKKRDDWIVTTNLFGGVCGDPSSKKSPGIAGPMRMLDILEAREDERLEEERKAFQAELASYEATEAFIRSNMKKAAGSGDGAAQGNMAQAVHDLKCLEKPEEPRGRRFKSNDSTVPRLGIILSQQNESVLVFRDEVMGLLASFDREGAETDRAFYLEAFNGTGSFKVDRVGRDDIHIKNLCLGVFGGIQPELLQKYLIGIATSLSNDGLLQRFQVMVFPDPISWDWVDRTPKDGSREAVKDIFSRLATLDPVQDGASPASDFVKLPHLGFDDHAQERFIEWVRDLHTVQIPNEPNPMMAQHLAKFEKLLCAVALTLHLADGQIGPVKIESAERAIAWCTYLSSHARRIYGLVEAQKVGAAKLIGRRIQAGKLESGFTARDVWKKGWAGIHSTADAEAALAVLEDHGWVVAQVVGDDNGGRPSTKFFINPAVGVKR